MTESTHVSRHRTPKYILIFIAFVICETVGYFFFLEPELDRMEVSKNPHPLQLYIEGKRQYHHSDHRHSYTDYYLNVGYIDRNLGPVETSWLVTYTEYQNYEVNDSLQVLTNADSTVFYFAEDLVVHYDNILIFFALSILPFVALASAVRKDRKRTSQRSLSSEGSLEADVFQINIFEDLFSGKSLPQVRKTALGLIFLAFFFLLGGFALIVRESDKGIIRLDSPPVSVSVENKEIRQLSLQTEPVDNYCLGFTWQSQYHLIEVTKWRYDHTSIHDTLQLVADADYSVFYLPSDRSSSIWFDRMLLCMAICFSVIFGYVGLKMLWKNRNDPNRASGEEKIGSERQIAESPDLYDPRAKR